jgi:hypothetical protein
LGKINTKKNFKFFFQCFALPKDTQSFGSQNLHCPFSVSQYYRDCVLFIEIIIAYLTHQTSMESIWKWLPFKKIPVWEKLLFMMFLITLIFETLKYQQLLYAPLLVLERYVE